VDTQNVLSLSLASDDVLKCDMHSLKVSWKLLFPSSREIIGGNLMEVLQVNHSTELKLSAAVIVHFGSVLCRIQA